MDTCPICFENLDGKVKASPNTCDHVFCLPCIEKWAKLGTFCPVDRKRFKKIVNIDSQSFIQVKSSKRKRMKTVYDFSAKCEVCLKDSHADVLLLCDCCDLAFHLFCLTPPLKKVPTGLWYCPTCVSIDSKLKKSRGITKELEADLGNGTLQLEKIKESGVKHIDPQEKKQNSEEQINEEKNGNKFSDTRTLNNEQGCSSVAQACSKVASEFEDLNVEKNCSQRIVPYSLRCPKQRKIVPYSLRGTKQREIEAENSSKCLENANDKHEKEYIKCSPVQSEIHKNTELLYSNDLCLNKKQNDDNLLDDCSSHSDLYGDMEIGIVEENMSECILDKLCKNMERVPSSTCYKSSHNDSFKKQIPEISPPSDPHSSKIISSENIFQQSSSSFCNSSKDWMQENVGLGDSSNVNISSPCCSISSESSKDMNILKARSNGMLNTHFYQNEDSIEDFAIKSIGSSKKNTCAIKNDTDSSSPNNSFYIHFCKSSSLKPKISTCNINETFSLPSKSGDKASFFNSCEQENTSKCGRNDDSNFMLNNFGFSQTSINKDKSCENDLLCRTQSNISCHQNKSLSNVSSTERKSEAFARSNHSPLNSAKKMPLFGRNDLKYLAIRSDGSLYIDLPKDKNTETENHHWGVSNKISDSLENINFSSSNFTYDSFNKRENTYQPNTENSFVNFKCTSSKDNFVPNKLPEHNSFFKSNKSEWLNSTHVKIENDSSNSYTSCNEEKSDFQISGLLKMTDSNRTIHKNDLKYLSIKENGTFSLDLPIPKNIKSEEKTEKKSSMMSNCKTLHHTDLKHLRICGDGTFSLDLPIPKNIKSEEKTEKKSSTMSNCKTLHHTDLKHLRICGDGTFSLDLPIPKNIKSEEKTEKKSSTMSNCKTLHHTDLKHLRICGDGTFFLDIPH